MFTDFEKVSMFFGNNYVPYLRNGHWAGATWEYAQALPWFDFVRHYKIGLWMENDVVVAICTYISKPGEAFIFTAKGYEFMKPELLEYAEKNLYAVNEEGKKTLQVKASTVEPEFTDLLLSKGYLHSWDYDFTVYDYSKGLPKVELPKGFSIITFDEENDYRKAANSVWKGFDHEDDNDLDCYMLGLNIPHFRKDLLFIAKADNGDYCSYGLIWLDEVNHYAFLEPMSTVPQYRRKGLGKALLYEAINRTAEMGATYMIGGGREFYKSIGFEKYYTIQYYKKVLD
jgi:GNAT superfamily N-acetyltransferase